MKPWHLRIGRYARIFVRPRSLGERIKLLVRGYRPANPGDDLWTKPNAAQRYEIGP